MSIREEQLIRVIKQMLTPLRNIPLDIIIESICGCKVLAYDDSINKELLKIVCSAGKTMNLRGIQSKRQNEVGNYIETYIISAIQQHGYFAETPETFSGKKRSAGYPDIAAQIKGKSLYIEVKSYSNKTKSSSLRSFYLSPSKDFKVTQDAFHLIFAFEMVNIETGIFKTKKCSVLDARNLLCDVKYEFNSDNRRLYEATNNHTLFECNFM